MAGGLLIVGCSTTQPPTIDEIRDTYQREVKDLEEMRDRWLARCETLPNTPPPPPQGSVSPRDQCIADAMAFFNAGMIKIRDARQKAIEQKWDEAYKSKKAYEEWLKKQLEDVNIPGVIRDAIKRLLPTAALTANVSGQIGSVTTNNGIDDGQLYLTGSFTLVDANAGYNQSGTAVIKLQLSGSLGGASPNADIYGGTVVLSTTSSATWTGIVETDDQNRLVVNAAGDATATVMLRGSSSVKGWGSVLPAYPRIQLKLTRSSTGVFSASGNAQSTSVFFGHEPHPITDYNNDGQREHNSDSAALLADQIVHAPKADINGDGLWDAEDTDLWLRLFSEDIP